MQNTNSSGFTLIEILVVMGLIAILASIVIVALSPAKHFAQARNTQRMSGVATIIDAIGQNMATNKGVLTCASSVDPNIPTIDTLITSGGGYNLAACLVPDYLPSLPLDPTGTGAPTPYFANPSDYDTGFYIKRDQATGRITITARYAELGQTISVSR